MRDTIEYYNVYPENKDCVYTTEHWVNHLSNGKQVTVLFVQQWRDGTFTVDLNETNKEKLLTEDHIVLNDWGGCTEQLISGWFYETQIKNKEQYNDVEIQEIHKLMFCNNDNKDEYNCEDALDFNDFEQDIMETNGWFMEDTIYEIFNGFELENMNE